MNNRGCHLACLGRFQAAILHSRGLEHVDALLDDVQLHKAAERVRRVLQLIGVVPVHIANVSDLFGDVV